MTTLVAVSGAVSATGVRSDVKAALLWIILLFAALSGLARAFVREEEAGTANALRLAAPATAVYAGKWLFNTALVLVVECVSVPLFLVVLPPETVNFRLLFGVLLLGGRRPVRRGDVRGRADRAGGVGQERAVLHRRLPRPDAAAADGDAGDRGRLRRRARGLRRGLSAT